MVAPVHICLHVEGTNLERKRNSNQSFNDNGDRDPSRDEFGAVTEKIVELADDIGRVHEGDQHSAPAHTHTHTTSGIMTFCLLALIVQAHLCLYRLTACPIYS